MSVADRELRLECMRLAVSLAAPGQLASDVAADASVYFAYITGTLDKTPRQTIESALDQAGVS